VLAEPIVVADGDSFLQVPIEIHVPGLPAVPSLTYTQMALLQVKLETMTILQPGPPELSVLIEEPRLPALPAMDSAQRAQLKMHLEQILKEP
jgi:hypothetical protein